MVDLQINNDKDGLSSRRKAIELTLGVLQYSGFDLNPFSTPISIQVELQAREDIG